MFIIDFFKEKFMENSLKEFIEYVENEECEEPNFIEARNYFGSATTKIVNNKIKFPLSKKDAFLIANKDSNLKTDFCKNDTRNISYLSFSNSKFSYRNYNNEYYWHIQITEGDISWISSDKNYNTEHFDGYLTKNDLKKLQCLINVNTGEYKYFSENNKTLSD